MKDDNNPAEDGKAHKIGIGICFSKFNELFKALIFSVFMTFLFYSLCLLSNEPTFLANGYTGGSDDLMFLENVNSALLLNNPTLVDLSEVLLHQTEHAPAYPFILYFFSKIAPAGIFLAIFLNFFALYFIGFISSPKLEAGNCLYSPWKFIIFAPGLVFVAFHAYKDLFLMLIILLAIKAFNDKKFLLGLGISLLSGYFRPYNWILIFLAYMLFTRFKLTLLLIFSSSAAMLLLYPQYIVEVINPMMESAHEIAYRDMVSYGSLYQPYDNMVVDYFLGMFRFIFLPLPWSIAWQDRPLFLSILELLQTIIIWAATIFIIIKPNFILRIIRDHGIIFWYCFLQASVYSILYFGNAQPRYRIYIYLICLFVFISITKNLKITYIKLKGLS